MTDPFHAHIRAALADASLQAALDGNAERRRSARQVAYASLPEDLQTLRQRAHAVRAETIAHLDRYLEQFESQALRNGLIVHHAASGEQAVAIVLEIARQRQARLVAKSKTMVGEEIEINHALEAAGIQVVETDLGEYIVQLRGERPAHILTPAVHLRRSDVARTFEQKLGMPYTEDIPTMTAVARRALRKTFLDADIGISGVNFGVAETGALVTITNEGNGRMVTTLPPVHIALMGMERLVPTLNDLDLMLSLLPRSGTGQKLSVYTSLVHSPRRKDEVDGALERHLILLDNGRERLRHSPLVEALYCVRCGACLNACPVFREIGGHGYVGVTGKSTPYPGPIGSVISAGLFGSPEFGGLARASSLCGACKEACPMDIDLPEMLLRVRAGMAGAVPPRAAKAAPVQVPAALQAGLPLYTWMARSAWRFHLAQRLAGFFGRLMAPFSPWLRLPAASGWGYRRDFPRPASRPFRERWAELQPTQPPVTPQAPVTEGSPGVPDVPNLAAALAAVSEQADQRALVQRFKDELIALGGTFTLCTLDQAAGRVLSVLDELGAGEIQAWDAQFLPPDLLATLARNGIRIQGEPDPAIHVGLTGVLAAAAATGTLVMPGGQGRPLTASLLPEVHIALLSAADIRPALRDVLHLPQVRQAAVVSLISGPSRTADIELTLTIGVHGPRKVHVICLGDEVHCQD